MMAVEVLVPEMGETGMELVFVRWLKVEGEDVAEGEPLFEVDTAKAEVAIEAAATGVLRDIRVSPGDPVEPRQIVAMLLAPGEAPPSIEGGTDDGAEPATSAEAYPPMSVGARPGRLSPRARRQAARQRVSAQPDPVRTAVAQTTLRSWREVPHIHLELEADVTGAVGHLRPTALLVRLVAGALRRHPECNVVWRDGTAVPRDTVDIGLLVDTDRGLLLATVSDPDSLDRAALGAAITSAADRARAGRLFIADHAPRSATISNLGMHAVDRFSGVIASPDTLLVTAGRIRSAPRWDGDQWERRKVMTLTLTMDHRVLDGADGARLLSTMETLLQDPLEWAS